jgi:lipopolysaccharide biosynthesis glycosyltransferase
MDTDVIAVRPFLQEMNSYLVQDPNAPIFAVLDIQANCPKGRRSKRFYRERQQITLFNRNRTPFLYFNTGFLLFRNGEMTKHMIQYVIKMISGMTSGFFFADQDCLWAFSNTSLYGVLPTKFNCRETRALCPLNGCGPETSLYHSHDHPAAKQAQLEFNRALQNMGG